MTNLFLFLNLTPTTICELLVNILATFIGLIAIFYFVRPKIKVSKKLSYCKNGIYKVKIINTSTLGLFSIYNINAEMLFYKQVDNLKITTLNIPLYKDTVFKLDRLFFKKNANYSYIFKTKASWTVENIEKRTADIVANIEYDGIIFRVIGTHSFSNITTVCEKKYSFPIEKGQFKSGNTMDIVTCQTNASP